MINSKTNQRELAYIVMIESIKPIEGSDNCECAVVGGWNIMVRKNEFKPGDPAVYFEIDSYLDPSNPAFSFMKNKHYKVKTQRYTFGGKGNFISQGLLMSAANFGWKAHRNAAIFRDEEYLDDVKEIPGITDTNGIVHFIDDESRFLTKQLGVTYYVAEDNIRKANSVDKYEKMISRHKKLFSHQPFCFLIKHKIGRKFLFVFFGKKKDKKSQWPVHICAKTDVERVQNMMWVLEDKQPYVATEKVDGSSFTIAAERTEFGKIKYYVCSRNVVFENENQKCFYDSNIYFEMFVKYNLKEKITRILNDLNLDNVAIQAEVYGTNVQKRDYSIKERRIAVFHIVSNGQKFPMDQVVNICDHYELPHVPIVSYNYILPDTIEELQKFVESAPSALDGKEKEGIVFYDKETGQRYFKFVSPEFLMKYH